jgi:MFS transporter, DHA2 family, metal-tetracycline-proton antiporter
LAEFFGWHSVFLFSALAVASVPFLLRLLPQTPVSQHVKFDLLGFVMFSLGIASLLIGLHTGWLVLVASAILLVAYFVYSAKAKTPFVDIRMFRNRPYVLLLMQGFMIFFCSASSMFVLPMLLTHVQHLSTGLIGLIVIPGSMIAVTTRRSWYRIEGTGDTRNILFIPHNDRCLGHLYR